jgi:hypothetical protein
LNSRDASANPAAVSEALCAPLVAGSAHGLELDLANETSDSPAGGVVQLFGGGASCAASDLLWTSPTVTASGWQRYCAPLAPSTDVTYLSLALVDPSGQGSAVYVDHLVPVSACP